MAPPLDEVCDSEDEVDILSPVIRRNNVDHRVATDPSGEGAVLPAELDSKASAENSTASTGELLRQAHLDLMAPTQPAVGIVVSKTSTSPEMNRTKRRLSVTDAAPPPSLNRGKLKRIKTSPAVTSRGSSQDAIPEVSFPHRDEVATSDTIPGDTFPGQTTTGNAISGATIPGDTFPPGYSVQGQTPLAPNHKKSTQQTPSEHQSSSLTPWSESAVGNSSARGSNNNISSDPPRSDDDLVGLPKEQYKPRPSRSRSEKVTIEVPLDYSIRPEKSTKAKRARTIDHSPLEPGSEPETGPRLFPKNPILQAPEFEALSPPSAGCIQVGLVELPELSRLDLPQTISETSPDIRSSSTQAKSGTGKPAGAKKRGRPRKNPLPEPVLDESAEGQSFKSMHSQHGSRDDVQVVISPRDHTPVVLADSNLHQPGDPHALKILQALAQKFPAQPSPSSGKVESRSDQIPHEEVFQGESGDDQKGQDEIDQEAEPKAIVTTKKSSAATKASNAKAKAAATKAKTAAAKAKPAASKAAANAQELALAKEDSPEPAEEKAKPADEASEAQEQRMEEKVVELEVKGKEQALVEKEPELTKTPAQAIKKPATARSSPATPSWQNRPIHRVGLSKTQKTQSLLKVFRGPR